VVIGSSLTSPQPAHSTSARRPNASTYTTLAAPHKSQTLLRSPDPEVCVESRNSPLSEELDIR